MAEFLTGLIFSGKVVTTPAWHVPRWSGSVKPRLSWAWPNPKKMLLIIN